MVVKILKLLVTFGLYALRALAFVLVYLLVASALMPLVTNRADVRDFVKATFADAANGGQLTMGRLRLAPFSGLPVVVEGLTITPPGCAEPAVELALVRLRYSPRALLAKSVVVDELLVKDARIRLVWMDGKWNLQRLQRPPAPPQPGPKPGPKPAPKPEQPTPPKPFTLQSLAHLSLPVSVHANRIAVENLSVTIRKPGALDVDVRGLTTTLRTDLDRQAAGEVKYALAVDSIRVAKGSALSADIPRPLKLDVKLVRQGDGRLHLTASLDLPTARVKTAQTGPVDPLGLKLDVDLAVDPAADQITIDHAIIEVPGVATTSIRDAKIDQFARKNLRLTHELDVQLKPLLALIPEKFKAKLPTLAADGRLNIVTDVQGHLNDPAAARVGEWTTRSKVALDLDQATCTLIPARDKPDEKPLTAAIGGWRTDVTLQAAYNMKTGVQSLALKGKLLDLKSITARLKHMAFGLDGAHLALDVGLSGFPAVNAAVRQVDLNVTGVRADLPTVGKVELPLKLSVKGDVTGAKDFARAELKGVEIKAAAGKLIPTLEIAGDIKSMGRTWLDLTTSATVDVGETLDFVAAHFVPKLRDAVGKGKVGGAISARVHTKGFLPSPGETHMMLSTQCRVHTALSPVDYSRGTLAVKSGKADLDAMLSTLFKDKWTPTNNILVVKAGLRQADLPGNLKVGQLDLALEASMADKNLSKAQASATASVGDFEMAKLKVGGLDLKLDAEAEDKQLSKFKLAAGATVRAFEMLPPPPKDPKEPVHKLPPLDLALKVDATGSLTRGDFDVAEISAAVPDTLSVAFKGWQIRGLGVEGVKGTIDVAAPALDSLSRLAQAAAKKPLPAVTGALTVSLGIDGKLPIVGNYAKIVDGKIKPSAKKEPLKIWPLDQFTRTQLPVKCRLYCNLKDADVSLGSVTLPITGKVFDKEIKKANFEWDLHYSPADLTLATTLSAADVRMFPAFPNLVKNEIALDAHVSDWDLLRISRLHASAHGGMVKADGNVELYGLSRVTKNLERPDEPGIHLDTLLNSVGGHVDLGVTLQAPEQPVITNVMIAGSAGVHARVGLVPAETLSLDLLLDMKDLEVRKDQAVLVSGVTGQVPLTRKMTLSTAYTRARQATRRTEPLLSESVVRQKQPTVENIDPFVGSDTVSSELTDYSAVGSEVVAASVMPTSPYALKDLQFMLSVDQRRILLDRLQFELLGGLLRGRCNIMPLGDTYRLFTGIEFTNINFKLLVPERLRGVSDEEAKVNGNAAVTVVLSGERSAHASPLDDIEVRLFITKIGSRALDQFLLSLDPKEENPSIVNLRGQLALARPKRVSLVLKRGLANLDVELEGLVASIGYTRQEIPYVPVGKILQDEKIREALGGLTKVQLLLAKLTSTNLYLGDDGKKIEFK